jgi:hypothetical protein
MTLGNMRANGVRSLDVSLLAVPSWDALIEKSATKVTFWPLRQFPVRPCRQHWVRRQPHKARSNRD